jgi:acetyl-CoA C-acetyltransferase
MRDAFILSAVRTPTGKFLGQLKDFPATQLGSLVVAEALRRAGVDAQRIDECIMGNVVSAGLGQNPARQAALGGGLPPKVAAMTINMVCGSGLKAVMLGAQSIATGSADVVVAGGMESMSRCPYLLPAAREGMRLGHAQAIDSMITDGLWCAFENWHMGLTGEVVAEKYAIDRATQDAYAARSHEKAAAATRDGAFASEILPVSIPQRKGEPLVIARDEPIREDTTPASLAALKPAFKKDGTVTAGNAPGVNDGAAALVVAAGDQLQSLGATPIARIVGQAMSGLEPKWVMMTPVEAVKRVLARVGWTTNDVDLFEVNEAFSVQALAVMRELGLDPDRVNVNGGAVALGHPIGASGARILTTLLHALQRRGLKRGVAALCLGGGNGVALAVERV